MACSHIDGCELFVQFALNPALDIWKEHYCEGNFEGCVRYQTSKSGKQIPLTLLPNGATISHTGSDEACGSAAIFNAILKDRLNMIRSLTKIGVDINTRNIDGQTPLMAAIELGRREIVRFLLNNSADPQLTDDYGQNALDIAARAGHRDIVELLERRGATANQAEPA